MFMHVFFENEAILECVLTLPTPFHVLSFLLERIYQFRALEMSLRWSKLVGARPAVLGDSSNLPSADKDKLKCCSRKGTVVQEHLHLLQAGKLLVCSIGL
jgi:hypothetical protein